MENQKKLRVTSLVGEDALPPAEARKRQKSRFENFTDRQKDLVTRLQEFEEKINNPALVRPSPNTALVGGESSAQSGTPQSQRFETRALKYQDFLTRARNNRDRAIARAQNQP